MRCWIGRKELESANVIWSIWWRREGVLDETSVRVLKVGIDEAEDAGEERGLSEETTPVPRGNRGLNQQNL